MGLHDARIRAGLTMDELAEMAGITAASVCRYEHGDRIPKTPIAKRLGKILGVKWYTLIDTAQERTEDDDVAGDTAI